MSLESGDRPFSEQKTVTPRTREAVNACLSSAKQPDRMLTNAPQLTELFSDIGDEAIPAFTERLHTGDDDERLVVSSGLLMLNDKYPGAVPAHVLSDVDEFLKRLMTGSDSRLQFGGCWLLLDYPPRIALSGILKNLRDDPDSTLAMVATIVSVRMDPRPAWIEKLKTAILRRENYTPQLPSKREQLSEVLAMLAAIALLQENFHRPLAITAIKERIRKLPAPIFIYRTIAAIRAMGPAVPELAGLMAEFAHDESVDPAIRQVAASALAATGFGAPASRHLVLTILNSSNVALILGVLDGLTVGKHHSEDVAKQLGRRLSSPRRSVKHAAACGLSAMGKAALPVKEIIIQHLAEETDNDTCERLTEALAKMGDDVINDLLSVIPKGNEIQRTCAANALVTIGGEAAIRIAYLLPAITNRNLYEFMIAIIASMGRLAAPATAQLAAEFDATNDELKALYIVRAIFYCGSSATDAIASLIRFIARRGTEDNDIGAWAEQALFAMREKAVAALTAAIGEHEGIARVRLEKVLVPLAGRQESNPAKYAFYASLECNDLIEKFVLIGEILKFGPMSWPALSNLIKKKEPKFAIDKRGVSAAGLRTGMRRLSKKLNVQRLTEHANNKKGGLSDDGTKLLPELKRYRDYLLTQSGKPLDL